MKSDQIVLSLVRLFVAPWTWNFPGKNTGADYISYSKDLPDPGIELSTLESPASAGRFFTTRVTWEVGWLSDKESSHQCKRPGFDRWVGKLPWRRIWLPTPVILLGKFHGQRSLVS